MSNFHQRRDSDVTVASSDAEDFINSHEGDSSQLENHLHGKVSSQNNVKIDGSKVIHVGDVIHNYYSPSKNGNEVENFSAASENSETLRKQDYGLKSKIVEVMKRRKILVILVTTTIVVAISVGISIFVVVKASDDKEK
jgi:hypothetical protein